MEYVYQNRSLANPGKKIPLLTDHFAVAQAQRSVKSEPGMAGMRLITKSEPVPGEYDIIVGHIGTRAKNAADVKKRIRRVRPQERAEIEELDRQIAELKRQKQAAIRKAWNNGHVITFKEVKERARR